MAWTLLLAAGQGNRLASATGGLAKQFLDWKGAPLYWESTLVFSRCARVEGLVFVFPEACIDEERERVAGLMRNASLGIPWKVVAGGALRQDSVRNGLSALPDDCMEVLIRQGRLFRPCWSTGYWTGCMVKLRGSVSPHVSPAFPWWIPLK